MSKTPQGWDAEPDLAPKTQSQHRDKTHNPFHSTPCITPEPLLLHTSTAPQESSQPAGSWLPAASCCGVMQAQVASGTLFRSQRNHGVFSQAQAQQGQTSPTHGDSTGRVMKGA